MGTGSGGGGRADRRAGIQLGGGAVLLGVQPGRDNGVRGSYTFRFGNVEARTYSGVTLTQAVARVRNTLVNVPFMRGVRTVRFLGNGARQTPRTQLRDAAGRTAAQVARQRAASGLGAPTAAQRRANARAAAG